MDGLLIAIISCRCRLVSQACFPLGFRFWLTLTPCLPNLSSFMISLLAAAAALSVKLVFLHDFALFLLLPPCLPSLSPFMISFRLVSQVCFPLGFRFWLPVPPCLPNLSPFMISLLAAAAALCPKFVFLHDFALFLLLPLVSQACLPS